MESEKDIVERLREEVAHQRSVADCNCCSTIIMDEAAKEIEELRNLIEVMKKEEKNGI